MSNDLKVLSKTEEPQTPEQYAINTLGGRALQTSKTLIKKSEQAIKSKLAEPDTLRNVNTIKMRNAVRPYRPNYTKKSGFYQEIKMPNQDIRPKYSLNLTASPRKVQATDSPTHKETFNSAYQPVEPYRATDEFD